MKPSNPMRASSIPSMSRATSVTFLSMRRLSLLLPLILLVDADACRPPVIRTARPSVVRHLADNVGCSIAEARQIAARLPTAFEQQRVPSVIRSLRKYLSLGRAELVALLVSQPDLLLFSDSDLNYYAASQRLAEWQQPGLRGSHGNFLSAPPAEVRAAVRRSPYRQTSRHKRLAADRLWRAEQALHDTVAKASAASSVVAAARSVRRALDEATDAGVSKDSPQRRRAASLLQLLEKAEREGT